MGTLRDALSQIFRNPPAAFPANYPGNKCDNARKQERVALLFIDPMKSPNELKGADLKDPPTWGQSAHRMARKAVLVVFLTAALSAAGWYCRYSGLQDVPPAPARPSQVPRAIAAIALDSSRLPANGDPIESPSAAEQTAMRPDVEISIHQVEQFREYLRKALVQELAPAYPQLPDLNRETANGVDPGYRDSVFQFLHAAENAPSARQAAVLLAADFMLQALWCPSEQKDQCDLLRNQFAEHKLTLVYSELGGGSYYRHDLLWRVWQHYPATDWGEGAFVLLLDWGWDTSGTCAKGADHFREVIRQGELFLQQHPHSPYRGFVTHLVGQAYATWWSLSNEPTTGMADYVNPKAYKEGSEQARLKAIGYFEQVLQLSPGTPLSEYARQILPTLRKQQLTEDGYRFFCVYD